MTAKHGELIDDTTVRFERLLPGAIDRLWQFLVDGDKRSRWLCAGKFVLEAGGAVEMHFHNASLSTRADILPPEKYRDMPEQQSFSGYVTRCEPPRCLSHTWDYKDEQSEVNYELDETGDSVRLTLTHTGLGSSEEIVSVCAGWHTHLEILAAVLDGEQPPAFWKTHTAFEADYEKRLRSRVNPSKEAS